MKLFVVSDTHFFHKNIIRYCQRPFADINEMTEALVANWNEAVGPDDVVLHLGDVCFNYGRMFEVMERLNGRKQLILGNHDWGSERMSRLGFECLTTRRNETYEFEHEGIKYVVAHRPRDIPTWEEGDTRIRLCGHEHNNMPEFIKWVRDKGDEARPIMSLNMSCEWWDYKPMIIGCAAALWELHFKKHFK